MPEKDPFNYSLITYAWVIFLAVWGGVVSFYRKMRTGAVRAFNVTELVGEIVTAGFVGVITFWLCEASGFHPLITAAFVGISGHMGSRGIFALEQLLGNRLGVSVHKDGGDA
jgi:hypothetical protein